MGSPDEAGGGLTSTKAGHELTSAAAPPAEVTWGRLVAGALSLSRAGGLGILELPPRRVTIKLSRRLREI